MKAVPCLSVLLAACTQNYCFSPACPAEGSRVVGSEQGPVPVVQQQHSCFVTCRTFTNVDVRAGKDPVGLSGAGLRCRSVC